MIEYPSHDLFRKWVLFHPKSFLKRNFFFMKTLIGKRFLEH
jgi:hypothetical protein